MSRESDQATAGEEKDSRLIRVSSGGSSADRTQPPWVVVGSVLLVVALGAFLRVYMIGTQPLWLSEADSLKFARESLTQLWSWSTIVDPGNPPLYYALLHGWLAFGDSEATIRLLSALFGVLTIPLVYALGRTVRDHLLGLVAALLFAISPYQLRYAQNVRTYSLFAFGATLAMVGIAYILRHPESSGNPPGARWRAKRKARREGLTTSDLPSPATDWAWLAYVLGTAVALLAHNTAVFLVIAANALMLGWWWLNRRTLPGFLRNWLGAQLIVVALWGTWLPAFLQQLSATTYSWIPRPTLQTVLVAAYDVYAGSFRTTPFLVEGPLIVLLACLGVWSWRHNRIWIAFVLVLGLVAPVGELIISFLVKPVFLNRTLIWTGVPLCLAMAAGVLASRPRILAACALAALVALTGLGIRNYYLQGPLEAWDEVAAFVDLHQRPGDALFFFRSFVQIPFDYYHSPPDYSIDELGIAGTAQGLAPVPEEARMHSRVWLVVSHAKNGEGSVIAALEMAGHLVSHTRFKGVSAVDVYLFEIGG